MKNNTSERSLSTIAALLTFALFAMGILSVLVGGANVYERLSQRDRQSYDSRTCTQYIATKLHQAPAPDAVSVAAFGDGDALVIAQQIEGEGYVTRIYCHDGWLMELFTVDSDGFFPEDGEKILPLSRFSLYKAGSLMKIAVTDDAGESTQLTVHIRGSEEVQP